MKTYPRYLESGDHYYLDIYCRKPAFLLWVVDPNADLDYPQNQIVCSLACFPPGLKTNSVCKRIWIVLLTDRLANSNEIITS